MEWYMSLIVVSVIECFRFRTSPYMWCKVTPNNVTLIINMMFRLDFITFGLGFPFDMPEENCMLNYFNIYIFYL